MELTDKINSFFNFDYSTKKRDIKLKNPNLELIQTQTNIDNLIQSVLNNDYNEYTLPDLKKMKTDTPIPEYEEVMEHDYAIKPPPKQDDYANLKKSYEYLLSRYSENFITLNQLTEKYQLLFAKYKTDTEAITLLKGSTTLHSETLFNASIGPETAEQVLAKLTELILTYQEYNQNLTRLFQDDSTPTEQKRIEYLIHSLKEFNKKE